MSRKFNEIMNVKIPAGSRTLYLDLAQNEDGTKFLSISEVRGSGASERSRILIDEEYVADLHRALAAMIEVLDRRPPKSYTIEEKRESHVRAYKKWTPEEENNLKQGYGQGRGVNQLADEHGRAPTAIISRLYQLGVLQPTEKPRWD